jgi:cytochrome c nitrite reductase small subunit
MTPVTNTPLFLLLICALGIPAGIGGYTFLYAKGLSYLSSDPKACVNCHIMNENYDGWMKSGHRHTATCVDCHLPQDLAKWPIKADRGFKHAVAFTLQNFKEPIEITAGDRAIVQDNCSRCHGELVHAVIESPGQHEQPLLCLHCHSGAGH